MLLGSGTVWLLATRKSTEPSSSEGKSKLRVEEARASAGILRGKPKPELANVHAAAKPPQVTSPQELPRGERHMLENRKLIEFVQELYQPTLPQRMAGRTIKTLKRVATR